MMVIENCLSCLRFYNTLIKYQIKVLGEGISGDKKIPLPESPLPDFWILKADILSALDKKDYSDSFIVQLNQLYQLSQTNSDLIALHNNVSKQLYKEYPITIELEELSFNIFEFLYNEVFEPIDEFERPINYKGFEDIQTDIPEYWFKDNPHILWDTYYFLNNIVEAKLKQNIIDIDNQKDFISERKHKDYIEKQKTHIIDKITVLSQDFCDRNFIFYYLHSSEHVEKGYMSGHILSDVLSGLNSSEFSQYIELDYSAYPANYNWQFEKKSIKDYPDLVSLPYFERLVNLLTNIYSFHALVNDSKEEREIEEISDFHQPELIQEESIVNIIDNKSVKILPAEYILPIPILDLIYKEFTDELWYDITLVEFLDIFTTSVNKQENFKLKPRQTVRFYYLLKKIWINSDNKALFNSEKEWIVSFLQHYKLSYSAYTNQFIKNEGSAKHRTFIRSVDKILPKDEIN